MKWGEKSILKEYRNRFIWQEESHNRGAKKTKREGRLQRLSAFQIGKNGMAATQKTRGKKGKGNLVTAG